MTAQHETYPTVEFLIDKFAGWIKHRRELSDVRRMNRADFDLIARDLRVSSYELDALITAGAHSADEMPQMLKALGIDLEDLARRTDELDAFIGGAASTYGLDRDGIIAVGFSNGANIAASLLLRRGARLRGAVLLSPMLPFEPDRLPDLARTGVFIGAGERDAMAPRDSVDRLAALLRDAGADVALHWTGAGHTITKDELAAAQQWIERRVTAKREPREEQPFPTA